MKIRAVILDVDGTLIASNDAHARSYEDAGAELGYPMPFRQVRPLIGMGGDRVLPRVTGLELDSPDGQRLSERKGEIFRDAYLSGIEPTPGARELLQALLARGLKLVIATSAKREDLEGLLRQAGVGDLVGPDDATTASDADESKPDPEIVQAALEITGEPAAAVFMLGDTPYDAEAARGAGVRIVGVRSGGWGDDDLSGASAVYDHPRDLLNHLDDCLRRLGG